jgi:putative hemolysin
MPSEPPIQEMQEGDFSKKHLESDQHPKFIIYFDNPICKRDDLMNISKLSKLAILAMALLAVPTAMGAPNPTAVYCDALGYEIETRNNDGCCVFPDGSACEEWAFYRGECGQQFTYCE